MSSTTTTTTTATAPGDLEISTNTSTPTLDLTIFSDTICPFCYIGYKKILMAIDTIKKSDQPINFTIKFEPYQLDPSLPTTHSLDKTERYKERFGGDRFESMQEAMKQRGKLVGINFSYGGSVRQTIDSHRLLEKAFQLGGEPKQRVLAEKLFAGYFEHEKDIGDHEFLAETAAEAGVMSKEEALEFLAGDDQRLAVDRSIDRARRYGISGVPFTIINHKYAISGAQEPEAFLQVFRQVADEIDETDE